MDGSVSFLPIIFFAPKEHHQNVVHKRNGREGQRRLRAKNSARWNVFRSGGRLPFFKLIESQIVRHLIRDKLGQISRGPAGPHGASAVNGRQRRPAFRLATRFPESWRDCKNWTKLSEATVLTAVAGRPIARYKRWRPKLANVLFAVHHQIL